MFNISYKKQEISLPCVLPVEQSSHPQTLYHCSILFFYLQGMELESLNLLHSSNLADTSHLWDWAPWPLHHNSSLHYKDLQAEPNHAGHSTVRSCTGSGMVSHWGSMFL